MSANVHSEVAVKESSYIHTASDGKAIFVRKWLPNGKPKAVLLVVHGMAEHSGRYSRLAACMTASNWAVYAPDCRGHGRTAGTGELGYLADRNGFSRVRDDLREIALEAAAEVGGAPLFLFGHSMGSLLAESYIMSYGSDLSGCVLSGLLCPFPPLLLAFGKTIAALGSLFKGARSPAKLLHRIGYNSSNKDFEPVRTPADWLSRDSSEVDAFIADPLCGFICSFGFYRDLLSGFSSVYKKSRSLSRIPKALPLFILSGAEDPLGGAVGFVPLFAERLKTAGVQDVETRLYPGARHEILNETNREEVQDDIRRWLESRLLSLPRS
jgi:alpha-beta hydrolase superfamily lysophospholipase